MGAARHLSLLPDLRCETRTWPVPFADGIAPLLGLRGQRVVVLASGDPFWFGAGSVLARHLDPGEWRALPVPSTFSRAAAVMGWPLETTPCLGLHAAPLTRLRPYLRPGAQALVLLRDGAAVCDLATWLCDLGWGDSTLTVMHALGGPRQSITTLPARDAVNGDFAHPVGVALDCAGDGVAMPTASGRSDTLFDHDGQITKRPVRALTLSALAPVAGEHLWDIGGGSGSIAIEWLLSHPAMRATTIEADTTRAARITANAATLGVDHLRVVTGTAPDALAELTLPDAVFIGGGLSADLLGWLKRILPRGTRIVANAVTLETEALLMQTQGELGGDLLRIELSNAAPLGRKRGWKASFPIVQWSVTL